MAIDTKNVADFVVTTSFDKLPTNVVAKAKMCVLDILGGSLAAHETKSANYVRGVVQRMGGREESTLIGVGTKVPAPLAAWANGVLASALDIDEYKNRDNAVRAVNNLLRRLMKEGLVERKRVGKTYRYVVSSKFQTLMVDA